jgi:glycosyltransferase A (GT-A) superfamily protein (DUF2064 family)
MYEEMITKYFKNLLLRRAVEGGYNYLAGVHDIFMEIWDNDDYLHTLFPDLTVSKAHDLFCEAYMHTSLWDLESPTVLLVLEEYYKSDRDFLKYLDKHIQL